MILFSLLLLQGPLLVPIQDTQLLVRSLGKGEAIVFLHGGPGFSHDYFLPECEDLARDHRLIFFDQRLSGASSAEMKGDALSMETFVADIQAVADHFEVERFHLLGHSYGGLVAMFYSLAHPERLKSLILVGSITGNDHDQAAYSQSIAGRVKPEYQQAMKDLQSSEGFRQRDPAIMQAFFRIAFKPTLHDPNSSDRLNLVFQADYGQKSQRLRTMLSTMEHYHLEKDLRLLEIPVLLLYGASDPMPEEKRVQFEKSFQKVQRVEIPAAGHFPFVENKEPFLSVVREFVKQSSTKP